GFEPLKSTWPWAPQWRYVHMALAAGCTRLTLCGARLPCEPPLPWTGGAGGALLGRGARQSVLLCGHELGVSRDHPGRTVACLLADEGLVEADRHQCHALIACFAGMCCWICELESRLCVPFEAASLLDELLKSEGVMIHEVFRLLSSTLDWQLLAASGWPLFRLLARLEYFAHLEMGSANPLNDQLLSTWAYEIPFLETVEHHLLRGTPVPAAASSLVLSYTDYYSPLARALALLALADVLRAPQRLTPEELGESNRLVRRAVYLLSAAWTKSIAGRSARGDGWVARHQEHFLSATYPPFVALSARWPIFQLADRLACQAEVRWRLPGQAEGSSKPWMELLPIPEKVSDVVRACRLPYCDLSFMELVLRVAAVSSSLQLLEVGANLGDCSLWAAAHLGRRLRAAWAVEPLPPVAAALRRSVRRNGWEQKVQVIEALAGERSGERGRLHFVGHADGNPFASASAAPQSPSSAVPSVTARVVTVAQLLRLRVKKVATILKLYAYGDLRDVLRGAGAALRRADALWLAFAAGQLKHPAAAAVKLFALLKHHFGCLALPSFQVDWCRCGATRMATGRRMGRWLRRTAGKKSAYTMVYVVAFKPGSLHCKPWSTVESASTSMSTRTWTQRHLDVARGCSFGRSRRQLLMAKRFGAGYESYFLGHEELELQQRMQMKSADGK
ncbi:unnamed protein product, partial [Durusdinium trenchii]